jgi:hypothetical protein
VDRVDIKYQTVGDALLVHKVHNGGQNKVVGELGAVEVIKFVDKGNPELLVVLRRGLVSIAVVEVDDLGTLVVELVDNDVGNVEEKLEVTAEVEKSVGVNADIDGQGLVNEALAQQLVNGSEEVGDFPGFQLQVVHIVENKFLGVDARDVVHEVAADLSAVLDSAHLPLVLMLLRNGKI